MEIEKQEFVNIITDKSAQIEPFYKNKNSMNFVFAFDDKYSKYFAVTLLSLVENSKPEYLYDIVIFTSDLSDRNAKRLLKSVPSNFSIRFFNIKKYITACFEDIKLSAKSYWSVEMYYRIFIPVIMNKYDKVLYLDSDTIFNNDIHDLFNIDFEDKEIIAISDTVKLVLKNKEMQKRIKYIKNDLGISNPKHYFNSGVILFNIQKINLDNYIKRFLNAMNLETVYFPDQDILNVMFKNQSKLVDWKWNLQYHIPIYHRKDIVDMNKKDYNEYSIAFDNPVVIHYTSPLKPWINPTQELAEQFWFYARKTLYYEEILAAMNKYSIVDSAKAIDLYIKLHNNKRIVLWGASLFLEQFIRQYDIKTDNILGIIDKNPAKHGTYIEKYKCYAPEDINKLKPKQIIISIIHYVDKREKEVKKFVKENCSQKIEVKRMF